MEKTDREIEMSLSEERGTIAEAVGIFQACLLDEKIRKHFFQDSDVEDELLKNIIKELIKHGEAMLRGSLQ